MKCPICGESLFTYVIDLQHTNDKTQYVINADVPLACAHCSRVWTLKDLSDSPNCKEEGGGQ